MICDRVGIIVAGKARKAGKLSELVGSGVTRIEVWVRDLDQDARAAASALGSLIAMSLAVVSFASELTRRTAYPLLARPIPRGAFVAGKYLGIVAAMEVVVVLMGLATAVTVWLFGDPVPTAFWGSLWLTGIEILVVVAIALMFSTMTVPVLAATYTIGVVIVGNLAADVLRYALRLEQDEVLFGTVLHGFYFVFPDLEKLSLRSQAANNLAMPADFVMTGTGYGLAYACTTLLLAIIIFSRREAI